MRSDFFVELVGVGPCEKERVGLVKHKALEGLPSLLIEKHELLPDRGHLLFVPGLVAREVADRFADGQRHGVYDWTMHMMLRW